MKLLIHRCLKLLSLLGSYLRSRFERADIAIFHELLPPPDGGGNQFIRALAKSFEEQGFRVVFNKIPPGTKACYFNSFNFNPSELRFWRKIWRRAGPFIHRIDGPIMVYRGFDDGADQIVWDCNRKFATHSILQSRFSLEKHIELGVDLIDPHLIMNASDPEIFYEPKSRAPFDERRIKIIATSWSNNPNKGLDVIQWLDQHLDFKKYEFCFAGRIQGEFENIRLLGELDSMTLADELRSSDVYLTASRFDPCSNSLIEALTCGIPAIYLNSGGHPEIVGGAGLGFEKPEEIPELLEVLVTNYHLYQSAIVVGSIASTAEEYLKVAGLQNK